MINIIKEKKTTDSISVCEIGSGDGSTAERIMKILGEYDRYYYFDYNPKVDKLKKKISIYPTYSIGFGNTYCYYDSYAWSLFELYSELKKIGMPTEIFDIVFLDASNTFIHDCSACAIIDKMMKKDSSIVINNTSWTFGGSKYWSPENNSETSKMFSKELIKKPQVKAVCELIFDNCNYDHVYSSKNYEVYVKK